MNKKIAAMPADLWACGKFRIIEPYNSLSKEDTGFHYEMLTFGNGESISVHLLMASLMQYDAIVFQRVCDPNIVALMAALKKSGKKVYMDVDDDLFNVSTFSPAYNVWNKSAERGMAIQVFKESLKHVDALFVSTPQLVSRYEHLVPSVEVFSNALDLDDPRFDKANSRRNEYPLDKDMVMWTGSSTHLDSLAEISGKLKQVFDQRPDSRFALCGNIEFLDMFNVNPNQKVFVQHVPIDQYTNIPSIADIGLAPVKKNKFNDCKSELKCLEYGIWGIPTVCTDAAPYVRFNQVSNGGNLLCRDNKPKEWIRNIGKLLDNENYRMEMGEKARQAVINHYNLKKINEQRHKFFEKELL